MPTLDLGRVIPLERGTWTTGTSYEFMDSVQYEGSTYVSIFSGTHTAADANKPTTALGQSTYWRRNARGFEPKGTYNANTAYERDNLVDYGGSVYRCIANTTAGTDPSNGNYWTSFAQGIGEYLGEWNSNDTYAEGSIVIWDVDAGNNINGLFRANQPTPQNTPPSNAQYWDVLASGFVWQGEWTTGTAYKYRSVVSYRGSLYLAAAITGVVADQNPTALVDWTKISDGFKWVGSLESIGSGTSLFYGDVVTFANGLYQVVNSTNGADDPRQTPANFRTLTKWWDWQGNWNNSTVYYLDQTLIYQNSIYRVLGTTTAGQNPDNASSLFQTIIEAPDDFTDYNSATKRLQIRRVDSSTNSSNAYANGEPVAIIDGNGDPTGELRIHDGATNGGFSVGTNAVLSGAKLASSGTSIYKSNGSTAVISESSGTATLNNVTLDSGVVFPAGTVIKTSEYNIPRGTFTSVWFPNDDTTPQITEGTEIFSQSYTPSSAATSILIRVNNLFLIETSNVADAPNGALFISGDSNAKLVMLGSYTMGGANNDHGQLAGEVLVPSWSGAKTISVRKGTGHHAVQFWLSGGWSTVTTLFGLNTTPSATVVVQEIA